MKLLKGKLRQVVIGVSALLVLLIAFTVYSLGVSGNRWFSSSVNSSLRKVKQDVIPGRIADRDGNLIAGVDAQGKRVYTQDEATRRALVHALGLPNGTVRNGVETFMSYLLYAYDANYISRLSAALTGVKRFGHDLRLSLSAGLSTTILQNFPQGKSGAVVVMNYRTGELLSLMSFPNFDPNQPQGVLADPQKPYLNNATQWRSAPGSTFKVVTMAAALKYLPGVMERTFLCTGSHPVGDITITEAGMGSHGEVNLEKALAVSCNITFAQLALELGDARLREAAREFGLDDHLLFSDLVVENSSYPREEMNNQQVVPRLMKELAWTGPGQSALAVTPLHMCLIASAIANDGEMMEPKLLLQAIDRNRQGKAQLATTLYRVALPRQDAETITQAMKRAVQSGTATRAAVPGLVIAGKTGSAQVDGQELTNAWFIGFIDEPTLPYAVCVVVNDAGEGSRQAAPLAGKIFEYIHRMR